MTIGTGIIDDDMSAAWNPGFGGGDDRVDPLNVNLADFGAVGRRRLQLTINNVATAPPS